MQIFRRCGDCAAFFKVVIDGQPHGECRMEPVRGAVVQVPVVNSISGQTGIQKQTISYYPPVHPCAVGCCQGVERTADNG